MKFRVFIGFVFFVCCLLPGITLAQNKVVVIPLIDDGITCSGTLVGTRWCDNGDSTVTDMKTGLIWLKYADWGGAMPWRSGTTDDYDEAPTKAGILHSGDIVHTEPGPHFVILNDNSVAGEWRLPTKTELNSLANGFEAVRIGNMRAFSGVQSVYWSSSTFDGDNNAYAWQVYMDDGFVDSTPKTSSGYVWPVRSAE